jgi:Senescence-associated protein
MDHIPIGDRSDEPDNVVRLPGSEAAEEAADDEMSYEEALAADDDAVDEEEPPRSSPPGSHVAAMLEQGVRVGAGLFAAAASGLADALRSTMPRDDEAPERRDPAATIAGAGLGATVTAAEAAAGAARQVADAIGPAMTWLVEPRFAKDAGEVATGAARVLDGQWKASQAEMVDAATRFLGAIVPEIARGLADQVDLTALVRERVDVDAIVSDVDVDRIVERIDVDAIVAKVDVNQVADRLDVDRVIARTDLTAIVDRLDLAAIADEVIADVDLPRLIRESSGAMANETVQTVRVQGMNADRLVARIVDKVLRREARELLPPDHAMRDRGDAT